MDKVKQLIVPALTALVVTLLVLFLGTQHYSAFGTATTPGTNGIPTVLSGGSQPTYLNALEASESFISDGPTYALANVYNTSGITYFGGSVTSTTNTNQLVFTRMATVAATTTPCAIQSPAATSTLVLASVKLTTSTTTAYTITLAKAANAFATTTVLGNAVNYAAGAQASHVATTTTANYVATDFVFAPSQWIVFGMSGQGGTYSPVGFCTGEFLTL